MSGLDFGINRYMTIADGTVPDVVIAFAVTDERTTILQQDIPYFLFVFCHHSAILSCRSDKNVKVKGAVTGLFKESSSGAA